jgi:PHD/YefM family antitoxin component YafN of YafNO toxin-antitoxin module
MFRLAAVALCWPLFASAQTAVDVGRAGPVGLVFPNPGAPISAEQVEERRHRLPDGTTRTETVTSQVYRDSSGRLRIESDMEGPAGTPFPFAEIIDPVAGSVVILIAPLRLAARMMAPKSADGHFGYVFPGMGGRRPVGGKTETEGLGKRTVEGVESEGQRITITDKDQPSFVVTDEEWYSKDLRLTVSSVFSGPDEKHTARLRNIDRSEPEPALFAIPPDYTVQEMDPSHPNR